MPVNNTNEAPQLIEGVSYISVTSGQTFASGVSIGGQIPLSGGGSVRDFNVSIQGSQTANLSAFFLRGGVSTASVAAGSAVSFAAADVAQVAGPPVVLPPTVLPGNSGTVYGLTSIDLVVPNGGFVVLTPSATVTLLGASSSGVTVGAGIA